MMATAMKRAGRPSLHFGSMTFAWTQASSYVDDGTATAMLEHFTAAGGESFDTVRSAVLARAPSLPYHCHATAAATWLPCW